LDYSKTLSPGEYMTKCEDIVKIDFKGTSCGLPFGSEHKPVAEAFELGKEYSDNTGVLISP
jgi:hypothetical protein